MYKAGHKILNIEIFFFKFCVLCVVKQQNSWKIEEQNKKKNHEAYFPLILSFIKDILN